MDMSHSQIKRSSIFDEGRKARLIRHDQLADTIGVEERGTMGPVFQTNCFFQTFREID